VFEFKGIEWCNREKLHPIREALLVNLYERVRILKFVLTEYHNFVVKLVQVDIL